MPDSPYIVHQPFVYHLGPLEVGGFGLAMLLCFVIGQILLTRELTRRGYDPAPVGDLVFAAVVGGLLGAKIYYAILVQDMDALFDRAGFVFWGGLIGGIIATSLVVRFKKLRWSTISDASAVSLAAARKRAERIGATVHSASPRLSTDNAAMIARAGLFHFERGERADMSLNAFATLPIPGLTHAVSH